MQLGWMSENSNNRDIGQSDSDASPRVGALLRASRTRVGEDLRDVSEILRIRYLYLEAIEACRYEDLPGETYAVGFIRSYAEHLGLDGEEVVRRFRAEQAGSERANELAFPTPVPESGIPKGAIVLVGVFLALVVYGGWYATTTDEDFLADLIAPVPDRLKHLVDGEQNANQGAAVSTSGNTSGSASSSADAVAETPNSVIESTPIEEPSSLEPQQNAAPATETAIEPVPSTTPSAAENVAAPESIAAPAGADAPPQEAAVEDQERTQSTADTVVAEAEAVVVDQAEAAATESTSEASVGALDAASGDAPNTSASDAVETAPAETPEADADTTSADVASSQPSESEPVATDDQTAAVEDATASVDTPTESETARDAETDGTAVDTEAASAEPSAEVTADDLNAASLRAATGQGASETTTVDVDPATNGDAANEVAGVPGSEVLDASGAISSDGIVIRATDNSWVEIKDSNTDAILFTGVMSAGASFDVPSRDGLVLDTGNAGVLDFFVDGQSVPKIGGIGAVRKGVVLDSERLQAGTASNR